MEIIYDTAGQTCNRFWSYVDTVAKAIENDSKVLILFWDKDVKYFNGLRNSKWVYFPLYSSKLISLFGPKYLSYITRIFGNKYLRALYIRLGEKHGFIEGWKRRISNRYILSHRQEVLKCFKPNDDIINDVERCFSNYKEQGYFIVGIHIRRGDYKEWEGGRYFFEYREYASFMEQIAKVYSDNKVCFFISTNEKYDVSVFSNFTLCETKFTTAIHDLYALSKCDRIVGPLSTFSRWASFYGNVPLCFVERGCQISNDSDFSVISEFYRFENGKQIVNLTDKK